jgi:endonuclease-3
MSQAVSKILHLHQKEHTFSNKREMKVNALSAPTDISIPDCFPSEAFANLIIESLRRLYPEAPCALHYNEPFQLLAAARLSAQCTDKRVNEVTAVLFEVYPDLKSLSDAKLHDMEEIVKPCGLYHVKAQNIIDCCKIIYHEYNGAVPDNMDELLKLPGVGRKIANLILGDVFKQPAYVADTHCIRIAGRLRLTDSAVPERVEADLRKSIPPSESSDFCHRMVLFGREYCKARGPKCAECPLINNIQMFSPTFGCRMEKL